jgi:ABC-type transport system involved in cytochrome bd biosynthesis fused ATPase/permease subunit
MTTVDVATARDVSPVRRLWPWVATEWKRLALAVFLGTMAIACGVGLLAVSAWLISSAALKPPIVELNLAIVGVRAFGIGRGCFRYAERLVSHDAAFRALSRLRLAVYDRLAVVAPAGVPAYRRGDLLERLVRDVDATQDLPLRVLVPYLSGAIVAVMSVVLAFLLLPAAGVVLLVSLLLAATLVPWITTTGGLEPPWWA